MDAAAGFDPAAAAAGSGNERTTGML